MNNLKSTIVCTVYRPPNTPLAYFDNDLTPSFLTASPVNKPVYILGDLNCNLLNSESPDSRALTDFCRSFNLTQMINSPTHVTEETESPIDVIITSTPKQIKTTEVMHCSVSDHDLIYATLELNKARPKPVYITTRSFKHYNSASFSCDISQAPWSVAEIFDEVGDQLFIFNSLFNEILDQHAPLKTIKVRGRPNPCITPEIQELMKTRNYWRKIAKRFNDYLAWAAYKNFKREVKREIRLAEREFVPWIPEATCWLNPAGETSVRSEVSEGPNASSLWWRTLMVSLCLIQILYLITDCLFKNVFLPATAVGQKRSREMNRFFQ